MHSRVANKGNRLVGRSVTRCRGTGFPTTGFGTCFGTGFGTGTGFLCTDFLRHRLPGFPTSAGRRPK
jgi:hypothetical protein